jgi:uncharacterized damage-inducible protein DinB
MLNNREKLRSELETNRDTILQICDALSDELRRTPLADGQWSVHDLIGHLAASEGDTLDHLTQTFQEGRPRPMPPNTTVDDMNQREAAKRKDWSWARVRAEFVNTRNALIQRVAQMSESDLQFCVPSPWLNDTRILSLETLMREDVLDHANAHLTEIRAWQKQNPPPQT